MVKGEVGKRNQRNGKEGIRRKLGETIVMLGPQLTKRKKEKYIRGN